MNAKTDISFAVSYSDAGLIGSIVSRVARMNIGKRIDQVGLMMDLTACHANGNPLRLSELLVADDFNFTHDVYGIQRHINRDTGKLENCFVPRFTNHD